MNVLSADMSSMIKSPKAKGSRLEYIFRDMLRDSGLDVYAQRTPMSGAMVGMKADILTSLPFQFECKNSEHWSPYRYYLQAKAGLNLGSGKAPAVVMKSNHTPVFVMMEAQDWINLAQKAFEKGYKKDVQEFVEGIKQKNPDKEIHPVPKPTKKEKGRKRFTP